MTEAGTDRAPALDLLRVAAATMVFLFHAGVPGPGVELANGLLVFFVLSGYLVYRPFVRARRAGASVALPAYALRRAARIYPAYLLCAVGVTLLDGAKPGWEVLTAVFIGWKPVVMMWTLAIEVQFYAALPVLDRALSRLGGELHRRVIALLALGVGSILGVYLLLLALAAVGLPATNQSYLHLLGFLWAFVPGMVVAELEETSHWPRRPWSRIAPAAAGLAMIAVGALQVGDLVDPWTTLGTALVLTGTLSWRVAPRAAVVFGVAGSLTYAFYLWHGWVIGRIPADDWLAIAAAFVVTVALAGASHVAIERPVIGWSRGSAMSRLRPRRADPAPVR